MKKLVLTVAGISLVSLSGLGWAERYSTWVDESGNVQLEIVKEAENPLLKRAAEVAEKKQQEQATNSVTSGEKSRESEISSQPSVTESPVDTAVEKQQTFDAQQELSGKLQQSTFVDVNADTVPSAVEATSRYENYTTEDYIDAAELEKRGFVRDTKDGKFYMWVDANGVVYNSPYPPEDAKNTTQPLQAAEEQKFSPFMEVERRVPVKSAANLPTDEFAKKLFKLDKPGDGALGLLSESCCVDLPSFEVGSLDPEEGYLVEFDKDRESRGFATGDSVYQLIRLPDAERDYVLRLRTFINRTLFYPTLVFLNEEMQPQRLVRHVAFDFEPENWFRYGYLEGWISVETDQNEKYLLVLTTEEDLKRSTLVQGKSREIEVPHTQRGLVHVAVMN